MAKPGALAYTYKCLDVHAFRGKDDADNDAWIVNIYLNRIDCKPKLAKYVWPLDKVSQNNLQKVADTVAEQIVENLKEYKTDWSKG